MHIKLKQAKERLRMTMEMRGIGPADVALSAGVTPETIRRFLRPEGGCRVHKAGPRLSTLIVIAEALQVRPGWLWFGEASSDVEDV